MEENSLLDKKSLRAITKKNPDWDELAKDCVCFANAQGGSIIIGVEDDSIEPPSDQIIESSLLDILISNIRSRTLNVSVIPTLQIHANGGQFIDLKVQRNASSIASTSKGVYYMRINDHCKPLLPDELSRLMTDKVAYNWETSNFLKLPITAADGDKFYNFLLDVRESERVSDFVKEKSDAEVLEHFFLTSHGLLTNLGVLWLGKQSDRGRLLYAPSVQFIKYNERDEKIKKVIWDDFSLNPKELIENIWNSIPEFSEGIEVSDGLFRKKIQNYDEVVIRELLANAFAHRPYTTKGDIFINLFPDRLEIHNPGLLPIGVTPHNILHKSVQRNEHLSKLFFYLKLMEKEGSGYDKIYEVLLGNAKPVPEVIEGDDRVVVKIRNRITNRDVLKWMDSVSKDFQLKQKEFITLGLIAQNNGLTTGELSSLLGLPHDQVNSWIGKLIEIKLLLKKGKAKGLMYFVNPKYLSKHNYRGKTNLKLIENHRLSALILEDLRKYPKSSFGSLHQRIGKEIPPRQIRTLLKKLGEEKEIRKEGQRRYTYYSINQ